MAECRVCSASTNAFLCATCGRKLERDIGDFPGLRSELETAATRQTRVYRASGRPQSRQEPASDPEGHLSAWLRSKDGRTALRPTQLPVDLDAAEWGWVLSNTVASWARHLAEQRGAEPPNDADVDAWLLRHVESIRFDEAAAEIFDEITAVHRDVERAVDRSPSRLYAGPCHAQVLDEDDQPRGRCDRDLYAWPHAETILCDGYRSDEVGCRAEHTMGDRYTFLRESVEDALVTIGELREAMPTLFPTMVNPPRGVWQSWPRNNRVWAVGRNRLGESTYRGGDLLDLVGKYTPKTWAPRRARGAA